MENKKNITGTIIGVVVGIIIGALLMFILYKTEVLTTTTSSKEASQEKTEEVKEITTEPTTEETTDTAVTNCPPQQTPKCYGTYTNGTDSIYKLNEDGSYINTVNNLESLKGYFMVNDNTISFITQKHTVGPREVDPSYNTVDYVISDDCTYFIIDNVKYTKSSN